MVMSGWSVHLTTLFSWVNLTRAVNQYFVHILCLLLTTALLESAERRRMTVEIISGSISMKVWDGARIKLATPGYAVRHVSATRHITDCAAQPSGYQSEMISSLTSQRKFNITVSNE